MIPFLALTETWLKSYVEDAQIEIPGYNISRCDRNARVGGGVLLYSHENLPITNLKTYDDQICEALICTCISTKSVICVLYRPPNANVLSFRSCLDFMDNYLKEVGEEFQLKLFGDFNMPVINWPNNSVSHGPSAQLDSASLLLDFMSEHLCSQYIQTPTRNENILDLFISNSEELVNHVSTSDTILSDPRLVEIFWSYNPCSIDPPTPPDFEDSTFRSLDFPKADFTGISSKIESVDWNQLWEASCPEEFPKLFTQKILQICESCCPRKVPPKSKTSPLVRILSRRKRKLQSQLSTAKNDPHWPQGRIVALHRKLALFNMDIRDAINLKLKNQEEQAVTKVKSNPKYFYSYAKKFSKKKCSISMLFDENNNISSNPRDIANLLQKQFLSVFSDPSKTNIQSELFEPPQVHHPFSDDMLEFSISDVIEAIDDIKPSAASGPDEIPAMLLKSCKEAIAIPISLIWSHSITSGKVPDFYKFSHVCPLHKKDSRSLPANYRPISLTSHIIKIYERIIRKKLVSYLESNKVICDKQHGFRTGHSCLTQLLHHFDDVIDALASGADFDSIYLDYAKAFDKVDHKLLPKKLKLYGVHPKLVKWIESFLTGRNQAVVVDGHLSFLALIISGVPQGTVLGPILFLIFINDIEHCITHSVIRCFADDTRVSYSIRTEQDALVLQHDLDRVISWSERNNMMLHKDKFEYMCHKSIKNNPLDELPFVSDLYQYSVSNDTSLCPIHQLRDLGVLVSSDLSWSPHIREIADKARKKAAWVLSVFYTRSPEIMLTLYKSMVRSLLEYCSPLWNPTKISDIQELESVQKAFTARISGLKDTHYWDRLKQLSLMSLQRRRERYIIIHMWKILNGATSNDLNIQFVSRPRFGNLAIVPPAKKSASAAHRSTYDRSFTVMGPTLWNAMPYHLNIISDLEHFKNGLTKFILTVPDMPPIRGYTGPNHNSLMCWKADRESSTLWGGHTM